MQHETQHLISLCVSAACVVHIIQVEAFSNNAVGIGLKQHHMYGSECVHTTSKDGCWQGLSSSCSEMDILVFS